MLTTGAGRVMNQTVVSHYEIIEKIGEGGYGTVYKARDLHVPRLVAVKFIYSDLLGSEQAVRRFQEEARAVCSLSHPNIVVLHDFDTDAGSGRVFLVLEYLPGGTLRELIQQTTGKGRPLHPFEICRCAMAIAAGLGHAHRHGIIHRDVKSSNVMFSEERAVKVTDFGLAKSDSRQDITGPGRNVGTPCYMSPEQARGLGVDHRTDIFSLGIVMYEMATGRLPFVAPSSHEVLQRIVSDATPSLKDERPDLPLDLDRIIQRATAKQPAERYQRMEELEADLAGVEEKLKKLSERPTESVVLPPERRTPRLRLASAAALAAILALAVFSVPWSRLRRGPTEPPPQAARLLAVIPFDCLGNEESQKAFCEGLAHTVSMKFTQMEPFQNRVLVVPYSEIRRERVTSPADANRLFKVHLALTASVEFIGENVRVIVNLVDAEKKIQVASDKLDASTSALARLQDETSDLAGRLLEVRLAAAARQQVSGGQTQNEAAFASFVHGLGYLSRSGEIEDARRAAELLEEAVKKDPSYALALAYLVEAYLTQYRKTEDRQWIDRARASCERALQINPGLVPAHIAAAKVSLARTDPEKAIEEIRVALRSEPKNADALRTLGSGYTELGMRKRDARLKQEGVNAFQQSIGLRPELWTTYRDLGLAYIRMGELPKAEAQYRRMLELTESADAYRYLGALYHAMDKPDDAIALFQKSIAIRPTPEAYSNLGTAYYYQGRYAELIPCFENAIRLSADNRTRNHAIWGNLGMAYMRTPGMESKGRDAYQQAARIAETKLRTSPKDAETHASLAYYLVRTGDGSGALRHARQAMELAPERASVLFRCSLVYARLKRRDEAVKALEGAIQKGHPMKEVLNAGDLAELRADPRLQQYLKSGK